MSNKPKMFYRILALFFSGAITSASLAGCGYGPPPVQRQILENSATQKVEASTQQIQMPILGTSDKMLLFNNKGAKVELLKKSEIKDVL